MFPNYTLFSCIITFSIYDVMYDRTVVNQEYSEFIQMPSATPVDVEFKQLLEKEIRSTALCERLACTVHNVSCARASTANRPISINKWY